ncbi:MAG: amino acid carrier protein [Chlamydiota bacterium]
MIEELYKALTDRVLFVACLFILAGSVYISVKTRFIQIRAIPFLWKTLKNSSRKGATKEGKHTISPLKALFTAMSTTLGISTLVGPVIAIQLGGPGALLGFILTSFLGSAVTYVEVSLGVQYRKKQEDGKVMGGPMQYLQQLFSPKMAKWYAMGCTILMMGWSAAQANQLTSILNSPALGSFQIPVVYSAIGLVVLVMLTLLGGVKRISSFSSKLVPVMFVLYIGSSSWILLSNLDQIGSILNTIFSSVFSPYALASGSLVGGVVGALRWGVFKGIQATEAGVGTQTIPHSLAETSDPRTQGVLAMLSTFSAGGLAFLSGCVALITNTWQDPSQSLGMGMVASSYQQYFSWIGVLIITISALLFGFGTILGNAFNGSQCYEYLMQNKKNRYYFLLTAVMIFLGAMGEVRTVWSMVDIMLAFIAVPHMMALLLAVKRSPEIFAQKMGRLQESWER